MTAMERMGYLAHTRTTGYRKRVQASLALIASHPDYAVSVSWGKDSIVLLHLAYQVGIRRAVHARKHDMGRYPDTDKIRDEVLEALPGMQYVEVSCPASWDVYEQVGRFFVSPSTPDEMAAVNSYKGTFQAAMANGHDQVSAAGAFVGMRADESRARWWLTRTKGNDYATADGRKMVLPLAHWSGTDVWGYTVDHDLPWLRIYDFSAHGSRSRERSEPAFALVGDLAEPLRRQGAWQSWQAAYPDWWAAWVARWPEICKFAL